jgi:hypothetical protein
MTIYYDTLVLSTIEILGLTTLLEQRGFDKAQEYCDLVYALNATTPYNHYDYTSARFCMMEELTNLVGQRLAEVFDNEQLDCGETFHWCALRILLEATTPDRFPLDEV